MLSSATQNVHNGTLFKCGKLRNNDIPSGNCRYMYTRVRRLSLFEQEAYAITCTCISLPYSSNIIHTIIIYLSS